MNAEEWIRDALQELGQTAAEQEMEEDEFKTGVRYANRMMGSFDYLELGYTIINSANDNITIPPYAEEWAVKALAVRLAPQFAPGADILLIKADEKTAFSNLLLQRPEDLSSSMPSNLPIGAGREYRDNARFYPDQESGLTSEIGQDIEAE